MPLPRRDFDPTEVAVPLRELRAAGFEVVFATPDGRAAEADGRMLTGRGLGPWCGLLRAAPAAVAAYGEMAASMEFRAPLAWEAVRVEDFAGVVLGGGHAPGMREYLESALLQSRVAEFFSAGLAVGAICHGVVLAARSLGADGRSVLHCRRTTALLRTQELSAWAMTGLWLGRYYRTYPETVESEVRRALARPEDFLAGPLPLLRDDAEHLARGFVVRDGRYVSARWPGDAHAFAREFVGVMRELG